MKESQHWHDRAREMLATGMRVQQVADAIGKSDDMVRIALNINGAGERFAERMAKAKERKRQAAKAANGSTPAAKPAVALLRGISLPRITMPDLPAEMSARPQIRLAPVPRVTVSPGVERYRDIHHRMMRRGLIPEKGLVEEFAR